MKHVPMMSILVAGALGISTVLTGCNTTKEPEGGVSQTPELQTSTADLSQEEVEKQKKVVMEKVDYYKEKKKEVEKPKEETQAIDILRNIAQKKGWDVKLEIKDEKFRQFVYAVAADAKSLDKDEQKVIDTYVKYVDEFENSIKNEKIKSLKKKVEQGDGLSKAELAELHSLLPIQKGIKVSPKGEPKAANPKEEEKQEEQNQEKSDEAAKEKVKDKMKELEEKAKELDPSQKEPSKDDSENGEGLDKEEKLQKNLDPLNPKNPNQPEQPELPGQGEEDQKDEENKEDSEKPEESDKPEKPEQDQDGEQEGEEKDQGKSPGKPNGYNVPAAVDYALKWWNKRNNEEYGYYSKVSKCEDCWADCTNFVSQVLEAGGMKQVTTGDSYWYYSDKKPSYSWGVANSFYKHFIDRAEQAKDLSEISVGDVLSVDFNKDGDIEHSAVVTKIENGIIFATYHSNDRVNVPVNHWFVQYDVYAFKMQTAKQ